MKLMRQGSWSFRSKSDSRWCCDGRGLVGMFCLWPNVPEAVAAYEEMKRKFGEPPVDLKWAYMKD